MRVEKGREREEESEGREWGGGNAREGRASSLDYYTSSFN
jgi:hypothetical protein